MEIKELNPQHITNEAGEKISVVLSISQNREFPVDVRTWPSWRRDGNIRSPHMKIAYGTET